MSKISWTDETINPVIGCSKISTGCVNCYAMKMAARLARMGLNGYDEVVRFDKNGKYLPLWNGETAFIESALEKPLHWTKPRLIFVCSMADLFHESVPFEWVRKILDVVSIGHDYLGPEHTFIFLTKRPAKMTECFARYYAERGFAGGEFLRNAWLGITAENQEQYNKRWPIASQIPASVLFVSCEPLLGPIDFSRHERKPDWLIAGGESGLGARPMHPDWARSLRDQCVSAGVPFHFKQFGEWAPVPISDPVPDRVFKNAPAFDGAVWKIGRKKAGNVLDGKVWQEFPK